MGILRLITPAVCLALMACSGGLTPEDAKQVVTGNSLMRPTDTVIVDAVSATSDTESVVRTTINGHTLNLKLRRFDKGWTWEFVETKAGGWIAPDVAIGQIREEDRNAAAVQWANEHRANYASTAPVIEILQIYAPNPTEPMDAATWLAKRRQFARFFRNSPDRYTVLSNDHPLDAWGTEIVGRFDASRNWALVQSAGPDKAVGTEDDLACLKSWRRVFEDGRMKWDSVQTWYVPEGLGDVVRAFVDEPDGEIKYAKVVKP